jgi:hypothetical protein
LFISPDLEVEFYDTLGTADSDAREDGTAIQIFPQPIILCIFLDVNFGCVFSYILSACLTSIW